MFKKLWNPVIYLSKSMPFIVGRLESLIAFVYWKKHMVLSIHFTQDTVGIKVVLHASIDHANYQLSTIR